MNRLAAHEGAAVARIAFLVGLSALAGWALAEGGSDRLFDREVQTVNQRLQRQEITVDSAMTPPGRAFGAAGRAADTVLAKGTFVDTGSRQFDSYVEQVNQQLRHRSEW